MSCCTTVLTPQDEWLEGKNLITEGRERTLKNNDLLGKNLSPWISTVLVYLRNP